MRPIAPILYLVLFSLAAVARLHAQWVPTAQLPEKNVPALAENGTSLFAATDNSLYRTSNDGAKWELASIATTNRPIHVLASNGTALFAGTSNDLLRSTDGGTTWVSVGHGLEGDYIPTVYVVQLAPLGGASILAVNDANGLFRSYDNGASWARGKITGPSLAFYGSLTSLAADGDMALAGTDESNIAFWSTDGGANWRNEWTGIPSSILAAEVVGTTLLFGTDQGGNFRSAGAGARWYPANNGMPGTQWYGQVTWNVNAFARSGTHLFVGTTIGVYMSSDTGGTWTPVNAGLGTGTTNVLSLAVLGTDLYAGTEGNGVWRRPLSEIVTSAPGLSSDQPGGFALYQNYPNPFNPKTVVSSQLLVTSDVKLAVYDLVGREVALLVNERREAGSYQDSFDARGLASGVYVYRLTAGSFVQSRTMVLMK